MIKSQYIYNHHHSRGNKGKLIKSKLVEKITKYELRTLKGEERTKHK